MTTEDEMWRAVVRLVEKFDPVPAGLVPRVQRRVAALGRLDRAA